MPKTVSKTPKFTVASSPYSKKAGPIYYNTLYFVCAENSLSFPVILVCTSSEENAKVVQQLAIEHATSEVFIPHYFILQVNGKCRDSDNMCVTISRVSGETSIEECYVLMPNEKPSELANDQHDGCIIDVFENHFSDKVSLSQLGDIEEEPSEELKEKKHEEIFNTMKETLKRNKVNLVTYVFNVKEFLEENKVTKQLFL